MKDDVVVVEYARTWDEILNEFNQEKSTLWDRLSTWEFPEDKQNVRSVKEDLHNENVVL